MLVEAENKTEREREREREEEGRDWNGTAKEHDCEKIQLRGTLSVNHVHDGRIGMCL